MHKWTWTWNLELNFGFWFLVLILDFEICQMAPNKDSSVTKTAMERQLIRELRAEKKAYEKMYKIASSQKNLIDQLEEKNSWKADTLEVIIYKALMDMGAKEDDLWVKQKWVENGQQLAIESILKIRDWGKEHAASLKFWTDNVDAYITIRGLGDEKEYLRVTSNEDADKALGLLQSELWLSVYHWKLGRGDSPFSCACCQEARYKQKEAEEKKKKWLSTH